MWTEQRRPVVAILIFDDVEVLDFAGPYEVLSFGGRIEAFTVAESQRVRCLGGLQVTADYTFADCPRLDVLIVPGGPGAREDRGHEQTPLLNFIREQQPKLVFLASVCTGSFLLGRAGLLEGRRATSHGGPLELFAKTFPGVEVVHEKIVDLGDIITSGGVSSGIDLGLHILERWFGRDARAAEARRLDGPWV